MKVRGRRNNGVVAVGGRIKVSHLSVYELCEEYNAVQNVRHADGLKVWTLACSCIMIRDSVLKTLEFCIESVCDADAVCGKL